MFAQSCILLSVLALGTAQHEPSTCNITSDIQGECILLQLCPRAVELLRIKDIKTLRNLTCGYDYLDIKVCCVTKRTDEALTFKSSTQATTTTKNNEQSENSVKLPPDLNTVPTPAPTEHPTTRVIYSTTFTISSSNTQKHTKSSPEAEYPTPNIPQRPAAAGPSAGQTISEPSFINTQYDVQTPGDLEQSQITPIITPAAPGSGGTSERLPTVQYPANILPNRNECGVTDLSDKIYGGQVAGLDEMPWLVRIKYLKNSREVYACHGSLITNRHVITAAHCVEGLQIIDVRLGEWDTETEIDCMGGECNDPPVDIAVEAAVIHPSYNRQLLIGDIALLLLATPVNFTEFIRPICLPTTEYIGRQDYDLETNYLTGGWGRTEYEARAAVKRKLILNAVPMQTCRAAIKRISEALALSSICAGGRKGEDSCAGDSGSSLVKLASENNRMNWFLYGITSFGPARCGTEGLPGIYTRTTRYMDWILNTISS